MQKPGSYVSPVAVAVLVVAGVLLLMHERRAAACMAISARGPVLIQGEEAIIVWDEANHTEHFIRRADFKNAPPDFGFLVPTPSRPTLSEADDLVFNRIKHLYTRVNDGGEMGGRPRGQRGLNTGSAAARVEVVEQVRIGSLDASVLAANDAAALNRWLRSNGYPSRPEMTRWLAKYTTGTWHVTAFKLAPRDARTFGTRAVRLSFAATEPFFPYSEPAFAGAAAQRGRGFRVTVIAPYRVDAFVGTNRFAGRVGYAGRNGIMRRVLDGTSLGEPIPANQWVAAAVDDTAWATTFDESNSRRGAQDLVFRRAADQSEVAASIETEVAAPGTRPSR